jgi:hypothetical protein
MSRPTGYSKMQIRLHWITVLLVALQYLLHEGIADAYDVALDTGTYAVSLPVAGHAIGGLLILGLTIWRILMLRRERGVPAPPEAEPEVFQHDLPLGAYRVLRAADRAADQRRHGLGRADRGGGRHPRGVPRAPDPADPRPYRRGRGASGRVEDGPHHPDDPPGVRNARKAASNSRGFSAWSQWPAPGILANFAFGNSALIAGRCSGLHVVRCAAGQKQRLGLRHRRRSPASRGSRHIRRERVEVQPPALPGHVKRLQKERAHPVLRHQRRKLRIRIPAPRHRARSTARIASIIGCWVWP